MPRMFSAIVRENLQDHNVTPGVISASLLSEAELLTHDFATDANDTIPLIYQAQTEESFASLSLVNGTTQTYWINHVGYGAYLQRLLIVGWWDKGPFKLIRDSGEHTNDLLGIANLKIPDIRVSLAATLDIPYKFKMVCG